LFVAKIKILQETDLGLFFFGENGIIDWGDWMSEDRCYTYIVKCNDGTFYTGWTNHLEQRILAHNSGKGAKYTKSRLPVELVYAKESPSKEEAMRLEWQIKQLSRKEKLKLIQNEVAE